MHLRKDINKKAILFAWKLLYSWYRDQLPKSIIHVVSCCTLCILLRLPLCSLYRTCSQQMRLTPDINWTKQFDLTIPYH